VNVFGLEEDSTMDERLKLPSLGPLEETLEAP
jgi:hypothetical protein